MYLDVGWTCGGVAHSFCTAVSGLSESKKHHQTVWCWPLSHLWSIIVISTTLIYVLAVFCEYATPPHVHPISRYITANIQFYQAFPHVSIASDKSWSKKAWVWGYWLVLQSWFSSAVQPLYLVLAVMPGPAVLALGLGLGLGLTSIASFPGLHAQLLSLAVWKAGEGLDGLIMWCVPRLTSCSVCSRLGLFSLLHPSFAEFSSFFVFRLTCESDCSWIHRG